MLDWLPFSLTSFLLTSLRFLDQQLPKTNPNDLTPLTDINWVSSVLESLATNAAKVPATWPSPSNSTSTTIAAESLSLNPLSMNDKVEAKKWEGEGRVLEIMYLD